MSVMYGAANWLLFTTSNVLVSTEASTPVSEDACKPGLANHSPKASNNTGQQQRKVRLSVEGELGDLQSQTHESTPNPKPAWLPDAELWEEKVRLCPFPSLGCVLLRTCDDGPIQHSSQLWRVLT